MALVLLIAMNLVVAGCIEVKDPPEEGEFTIELDSPAMLFVPEAGGHLEGAHAHTETELHDEHLKYFWHVEGLEELEGPEASLPATDVGVRRAEYRLEYYEQEEHLNLSVVTVPSGEGVFLAFADGNLLEGGPNGTATPGLTFEVGENLTVLHTDEVGTVWKFNESLDEEDVVLNVFLDENASRRASYVVGIHIIEGSHEEIHNGSIVIYPGEGHTVSFLQSDSDHLNVGVWIEKDNITVWPHIGTFEDLPVKYRTDIGVLEWEGRVGEEEEAPGPSATLALGSIIVVAAVSLMARRRLTRAA